MISSFTAKTVPPPLIPLSATIHPGNNPIPPPPCPPPFTTHVGSKRNCTRCPLPRDLEDSSQLEVSLIFALSDSAHNRPTTMTSSCIMRDRSAHAEGERKDNRNLPEIALLDLRIRRIHNTP